MPPPPPPLPKAPLISQSSLTGPPPTREGTLNDTRASGNFLDEL
jgi:hypothetical protein